MKTQAHILVVDDDEDILIAAKMLLKRQFSQITCCQTPDAIPELLNTHDFDSVMLDMNFAPGQSSGEQGMYWLQKIHALQPDVPVVMITAHAGINTAIEAMKNGASDFIIKPWQNEKVIATISSAVELGKSRKATASLRQSNKALTEANQATDTDIMIGRSDTFNHVLSMISRAAPTDANVLILGENGTGKELLARELHRKSLRSQNAFISVDLGAISETLFESELFGHKKGAFTGAHQDRTGRLLAADGGTLFLDEIGNLPLTLQAKLLSALSTRQVTPVGGDKPIPVDIRVVAATNLEKLKLTDEKYFRQDLLFRLNTVEVALPALRDRKADIPALVSHFVSLYSKKYQKPVSVIPEDLMSMLTSHHWPGNIRALRHSVERAVILNQNNQLTTEDFPDINTLPLPAETRPAGPISDKALTLEEIEKKAIREALVRHGYNISHTAKELGVTRAALYRRMEKHGL